MSGEVWKIEKDLCRCCHSEGSFDDLDFFPSSHDGEDVMCNMLRNDLGITINPVEGDLSTQTYKICEICKLRLLDATNFKRQVLLCEERFKDMYSRELIQGLTSTIEVKIEPTDDFYMPEDINMDTTGADASANMSEEEFKVENDEDDDSDKSGKLRQLLEKKGGGKLRELLEIDVPAVPAKSKAKPKPKPKSKPKATKAKAKTKKVSTKGGDEKEPPSSEETEKADKPERVKTAFLPPREKVIRRKHYVRDGDIYNCTLCEHASVSFDGIREHIKIVHYANGTHKFTCGYCNEGFSTPTGFVQHKLNEHGVDDRYTCKVCKAAFNTKNLLKIHLQSFHMIGERLVCDACDYFTYVPYDLKRHKTKHSLVKKYKCKYCEKAFGRVRNLNEHEKIHTGDKRKKCNFCEMTFVQKASLNYHMNKYHPEPV